LSKPNIFIAAKLNNKENILPGYLALSGDHKMQIREFLVGVVRRRKIIKKNK